MLFDWLVTGGVLATNPAHAVRGPKHVVNRGKTPVLIAEEMRELLDSIDTSTLIGLRVKLTRLRGARQARRRCSRRRILVRPSPEFGARWLHLVRAGCDPANLAGWSGDSPLLHNIRAIDRGQYGSTADPPLDRSPRRPS